MDFEFINHKIENQFKNNINYHMKLEGKERLHKSKLHICVKILCCLSSNGHMQLAPIGHKIELDNSLLVGHLRFLYDRGLVGEQNLGEGEKAYFVTERGLLVLKVMGPLVRDAKRIEVRNFEAISSVLSGATLSSERIKKEKPKRKISDVAREKRPKWKLPDFIKSEILEENVQES